MNLHEYQAKQLFMEFGIPVLSGGIAASGAEAVRVAQQMETKRWIVKAQIHAGGRGVGYFEGTQGDQGGIRIADSTDAVGRIADEMLGHILVTPQTGPSGREVKYVYVEQYDDDVQRELYLAMLVERRTSQLTLLTSANGGEDIESVSPDSVLDRSIDVNAGATAQEVKEVSAKLGLDNGQSEQLYGIARAMFELFTQRDASLIEINPLAVDTRGKLIALDATVTLDDNALFRHPEMEQLRDQNEFLVGELEAAQHGLNYVKPNGNVGCLASGAGLSLATLDAIKLIGGEPANFLDVPPVAQVDRVRQALRLVISDPDVESILINVFGGGIMRCDTIADALIMVNRETPIRLPLIVRLAGTNADFALRRLRDSGLSIIYAQNLAEAAERAVSAAKQKEQAVRRTWWERVTGSQKS